MLDQMVISCLTFGGTTCFLQCLNCFTFLPAVYEESSFSASLSVLVILKIITILVGVKWYLVMGLLFTFLVTNDVDHIFSRACQLFVYLLWRNAVGHFFLEL